MKPARKTAAILSVVFAALLFVHSAGAQNGREFPDIVPMPLAVQLAAMSEPLSLDSLIDASLAFSGSSGQPAEAAKARLLSLIEDFRGQVSGVTDPRELAEKPLAFLHQALLRRYSVLQTRVDTAIESGVYNCVSSAVLYMILARSAGLSVGGVRATDHAFCTVMVDGASIDVETTNPQGFDPGSKKEFTNSFGTVTGYAYVPPSNYRDRRAIGEKELLALILYNRVSDASRSGRHPEALAPAASAYSLMGNEEFRGVQDLAFSNYVSWLESRSDYTRAARFLDAVASLQGLDPELAKRRGEIAHNRIVSAIQRSAFDDSDSLLADDAIRLALGESDWSDLVVASVLGRSDSVSRARGQRAASQIVAQALSRIGPVPQLRQAFEAYTHNAFAELFNARKYRESKKVIEDGLSLLPSSAALARDLNLVQEALADR